MAQKRKTVASAKKTAPKKTTVKKRVAPKTTKTTKVVKSTRSTRSTKATKAPSTTTKSKASARSTARANRPVARATRSTAPTKPTKKSSENGVLTFLVVFFLFIAVIVIAIAWKGKRMVDKVQQTSLTQTSLSMADIVGIFEADLLSASSPGREITLQFDNTGEVTFTQDYLTGDPPIVETGHWTFDDNSVSVTLTARGEEDLDVPYMMTFSYSALDRTLTLVNGQDGEWGSDGLKLTKYVPSLTGDTPLSMADIVGIFEVELPAADAPGRTIKLQFNNDGQVIFTQTYDNKSAPITQTGTWTFGKDNQVIATLTANGGTQLSTPIVMTFTYEAQTLTLEQPEQANFGTEGLTLRKATELTLKTWVWEKTVMGDDTEVTPKKADAFTLSFGVDGSLSITTDCNNGRSSYTVAGNQLDISPIATTMMYCDGSQEGTFNRDLARVGTFSIEGDSLALSMIIDSGTIYFKAQ